MREFNERQSISKMERGTRLMARKNQKTTEPRPKPMTTDDVAKLSEKLSGVQAGLGDVSKKIEAARDKLAAEKK